MKSLKKKRRIQVIVMAALALALATGLIGYSMREGIRFFRSPSEVAAEPPQPGEVFRLGGMVKEGSIVPGLDQRFTYVVTDGGHEIEVHYLGTKLRPDIFGEGQGAIATGSMKGDVFEATEILAKHDESYMPREISDALAEHNKDLPGTDAPNAGDATN
jgi:cytochrome c-type biogenesis protein CcmE